MSRSLSIPFLSAGAEDRGEGVGLGRGAWLAEGKAHSPAPAGGPAPPAALPPSSLPYTGPAPSQQLSAHTGQRLCSTTGFCKESLIERG